MVSYLEYSKTYSILLYLAYLYKYSYFKHAINTLSNWVFYSEVRKLLISYLEVKSKAKYTYTYRALAKLGKKLDVKVSKVKGYYKFSGLYSLIFDWKKEFTLKPRAIILTILITFLIGYNIMYLLRGIWSKHLLYNDLVIIVLGLSFLLITTKFKLWAKYSLFNKLCKYLWE